MRRRLTSVAARAALTAGPLVSLVGRKRRDPGLDRQIAAVLELQRMLRVPPIESLPPPAARRLAREGLAPLEIEPAPMAQVIDTAAAGIPVRMFVPGGGTGDWLVYFHGGGGVIGSIDAYDATTRYLAARTGYTVASVDYRLAPEHPHPAGIADAIAAFGALAARVPAGKRLACGGDSFGGFLTAHVEHHARTTGARRPDLQILIYPLVDMTLTSPTIARFGDGYLLTRAMIDWFFACCAVGDRVAASPWFWTDLAGAAPAIVATAGFDPLVHEGDAWAERLRAAGTAVRHLEHPSLVHGFIQLAGAVDAARAALDRICAEITASADTRGSRPSR